MNDYKFVEPKTQASNRTIYIDADTIKELQEWKAVQAKVLPNCGFVLSYNSTPTSKTTLPRALEKLANLAGVHRIKIHALRHSHASLLISMGENPLLIKERLGHEKIQTTLGTYGHLYPNTNIEIAMNIPVRQHRKSGRRETVCPGLRKPFMRVYSRNVLSKP